MHIFYWWYHQRISLKFSIFQKLLKLERRTSWQIIPNMKWSHILFTRIRTITFQFSLSQIINVLFNIFKQIFNKLYRQLFIWFRPNFWINFVKEWKIIQKVFYCFHSWKCQVVWLRFFHRFYFNPTRSLKFAIVFN